MAQQTEEQYEEELRKALAISVETAKSEALTRQGAKGQSFHQPATNQPSIKESRVPTGYSQQPDLIKFDFQHVLGNTRRDGTKPLPFPKDISDNFEPILSSSLPSSRKSNLEYLEDAFQAFNFQSISQSDNGSIGASSTPTIITPISVTSSSVPSVSAIKSEKTSQTTINNFEDSFCGRSNWINFTDDPFQKSRSLPVSPDTQRRTSNDPGVHRNATFQVEPQPILNPVKTPAATFTSYLSASPDGSDSKRKLAATLPQVGLGSQSFVSYLQGSQYPTLQTPGRGFSDMHQALRPSKQSSRNPFTAQVVNPSVRRISSQPDFQAFRNTNSNGQLPPLPPKDNTLSRHNNNLIAPLQTQKPQPQNSHFLSSNGPDLIQFNPNLSLVAEDLSISDFDPLIAKKPQPKKVEIIEPVETDSPLPVVSNGATVRQDKPSLPPRSSSVRAKSFHAADSEAPALPERPKTMHKESSVLTDFQVPMWQPRSSVTFESSQKTQAENVFFGDGLFDIMEERDEEGTSFCEGMMHLRRNYNFDDWESNPGFVYSPVFKRRAVGGPEASIKLHMATSMSQPITFTCDVNTSVEHVISQGLCYLPEPLSSLPSEQFMLKVQGAAEFLHHDAMLGDFEYVQKCRKFDRDIYLQLLKEDDVTRDLARTVEDDKQDVNVKRFSNLFERPVTTAVTKLGLSVLMDAFSMEVNKLRKAIKTSGKQHTSPVIQAANAICHTLAYVETSEISNAVSLLKTGTGIESGLENLTVAIFKLIDMYCKAFDTTFTAWTEEPCKRMESIETIQRQLQFRISAAHRVPAEWKSYDHLTVSCQIFYGGRPLCTPVETWPSKVTTRFFSKIKWDRDIDIPLSICNLPRESRLCLTLYGSHSDKTDKTTLGWVAVPLFNYKSVLLSGNNLLGLWPDSNSNPIGTCASNIMDPSSVILHIELPSSTNNVIFPPVKTTVNTNLQGLSALTVEEEERISAILQKDVLSRLEDGDAHFLWSKRRYCYEIPTALPRILKVASSWAWANLSDIYSMIASWKPMPPVEALHLLNPHFADQEVRTLAVSWIKAMTDDDLCDYLPQLVQALKYESYHDSALANFLIERSMTNVRIAHYLYWYLHDGLADNQYRVRFQMVLGALLCMCGKALREQFHYQDALIKSLTLIADGVKSAKDSMRMNILQSSLTDLSMNIAEELRLPTSPSLDVNGINIKACSYYPSFTVPLKLSFYNMDALGSDIITIFKAGEDMRQDMLIMQMIRIMDKLWLSEGLDMRMITFTCLATGKNQGMIEVVQDAETLRKIQVEQGVTGSFKDKPLTEWLQKHNPTELEFTKAVENFTFSCAGYCVATYVLGVGDRHNDNIMVTKTGHMFHIDFGKFLGNAQMFGNIKRDRVPFVLSSDMAYVINGGDKQSSKFQDFVDVCCAAFNLVRKHANLFFNLFGLMLNSGIAQLCRVQDLEYVQNALKPEASDAEATGMFTRLIEASLGSKSTQLNFFVHNLAQLRFSGVNPDELSFAPKKYTLATDGRIISASVFGIQKRYDSEKYYVYIIRVQREGSTIPTFIFRRFSEFHELEEKLAMLSLEVKLPPLSSRVLFGRTHVKQVAERRKNEIELFLTHLFSAPPVISESDLVYTFFHPLIRDEKDANKTSTSKLKGDAENDRKFVPGQVGGQVKLSVHYKNNALFVMIMHAKDLLSPDGTEPDPYVKTYLLPDDQKLTKRKTKIVKKSFNPTFNEMLVLNMPWNDVLQRTLQLTVWNSDYLKENTFMGGVNIPLESLDLSQEIVKWYSLSNV
ncbi:phosphatidylinositol 4-phosphate 3-kinase C2 domain-containing subunit beta-like isoform X2 [Anneissia japonica]|uniref:phosphatidylinositol 4-phosphate 3-kinase C2 domain-containing subunit beta-like isoform X2 n=1 Tax=Anneissia japonica TaxID=1529436 RepID=UPI001425532D|nr:phosphatidylinositol 4-phosphate 3-kinase C2 domain-containing subunit beta-like isoform X2 [Anneissia japonica]